MVSAPTRTIGIIGGMGPAATVDFFRRIVDSTQATKDQEHLHVLVNNQPQVPDRTAYLLADGPDPTPMLIETATTLQAAGAELLVMACNTAHVVARRISDAISIPLVNWIEEASSGVKDRLPNVRAVGLLATDGTIASGLYQQAFSRLGVTVVVPARQEQEQVMAAIYGPEGVKAAPGSYEAARRLVDGAGRTLADEGAECILLACTELSVLFHDEMRRWGVPVFDAAQIVAERVIELAGGAVRQDVRERTLVGTGTSRHEGELR